MNKTNYTLSGFEEVTLEELQLKQANGELIKGKIYITQETGPDLNDVLLYVDSEILKNLPLRYYEPVIIPGSTMEVLELGGIELEPFGFYPLEALTVDNEFRTLVKATDGIYSVVFKLVSFNTTEAGPKPQFEVLSKEILVEVT